MMARLLAVLLGCWFEHQDEIIETPTELYLRCSKCGLRRAAGLPRPAPLVYRAPDIRRFDVYEDCRRVA